jgi:hypothetical protein
MVGDEEDEAARRAKWKQETELMAVADTRIRDASDPGSPIVPERPAPQATERISLEEIESQRGKGKKVPEQTELLDVSDVSRLRPMTAHSRLGDEAADPLRPRTEQRALITSDERNVVALPEPEGPFLEDDAVPPPVLEDAVLQDGDLDDDDEYDDDEYDDDEYDDDEYDDEEDAEGFEEGRTEFVEEEELETGAPAPAHGGSPFGPPPGQPPPAQPPPAQPPPGRPRPGIGLRR